MTIVINEDIADCFGTAMCVSALYKRCYECKYRNEGSKKHFVDKEEKREQVLLRRANSELKPATSDVREKTVSVVSTKSEKKTTSPNDDSELGDVLIRNNGDEWSYQFPDLLTLSSCSTEKLHSVLDKSISVKDYLKARQIYCSVQIELNRRYRSAPNGIQSTRFRPRRKALKKISGKAYSKDNSFLSNDTQIIAMHWHYVTGRDDADDKLANDVYCGNEFDFASAARFVVTKGSAMKKVEMIGLSLDEQWEAGSIQTDEIRQAWGEIQKVGKTVRRELKNKAQRKHNIKGNEDVWTDVAVSMLIDKACEQSRGKLSPTSIAVKYQRLTGEAKHRQSIGSILKSLDRHLPEGVL